MCSSAGYTCNVNRPGQDVNAIDITIQYPFLDQRVQVKCTKTPTHITENGEHFFSFSTEEVWRDKWARNACPPILVLVTIPDENYLFSLVDNGSLLRLTKAYWVRLEPNNIPTTIHIPQQNLLSEDVIHQWEEDILGTPMPNKTSERSSR